MLIFYNPACSCKTYSEFYGDGTLYAKRVFKILEKGEVVDGEDITYFKDGSIKIYRNWQDALPVGRFYFNHDNGKLEHEEFYEGKYKAGTWKYYDNIGRIIREQIYEPNITIWNSKKDDAVYKYYQNGMLTRSERVTRGNRTVGGKKVTTVGSVAVAATDGQTLYNLKCKACHAVDADGYGPALKNFNRKRTDSWLNKWISNAEELIAAGDKDALAIYKQWGNKKHPAQTKLTNEQIQAIIKYLKL